MAAPGLYLSFLLGIAIASTHSSTSKTDFEIKESIFSSDQGCSIKSVENIVDSRFKILAASFQDQIDDLKGKIEVRHPAQTGVVQSKPQHEIHKRQTKAETSAKPVCENSSSFCTFFHPDHPDVGLKKGNYSPTVTNEMLQNPTKVKGMPTSCKDLQLLGHKLNGLYLVKTSRPNHTTKIETAFCNFNSPIEVEVSQEVVGHMEVKTKNVHFYVQRNSSFSTRNAVVTFELERLNKGNAMNLTSGIFTAPVAGIYFFQFSGVNELHRPWIWVDLVVNGVKVGVAQTNDYTPNKQHISTISLSASLRLAANDKVNLFSNNDGVLYDDNGHVTHFTGWLVQEDLK